MQSLISIILATFPNYKSPWNLGFSVCKLIVSEVRCIFLVAYFRWQWYHFTRKLLRSWLHSGHTLNYVNYILIELPCVCLFCKKTIDFTMFLVYLETLTRTIGEKELEQLSRVINFRVLGGLFPRKTYYFCCKGCFFSNTTYGEKYR